jgi:hypothetical protein
VQLAGDDARLGGDHQVRVVNFAVAVQARDIEHKAP